MNARARVNELLADCGAVLKRRTKHEVYELPNGQKFVRGSTPSDRKSDANNLSNLKHSLGIVKPIAVEGQRKPKVVSKGKAPAKSRYDKMASLSLAESLRMAGLSDDALRDRTSAVDSEHVSGEKIRTVIGAGLKRFCRVSIGRGRIA